MRRQDAFRELEKSPYDKDKIKDEINYVAEKLNLTLDEFNEIMNLPKKTILDYPHSSSIGQNGKAMRLLSKIKRGLSSG
jgi:DNA-binding transcriptional regulator YiaG